MLSGFQLWVNLPARDKMMAPRYQEFSASQIPRITLAPGVEAGLIAGSIGDTQGPVRSGATDAFYADFALEAGSVAEIELPPAHNAFVYVYRGTLLVGEEGTPVRLDARVAAEALVVAGAPLREPVVRYGPFVMNTEAEIHQAVRDYQAGRL